MPCPYTYNQLVASYYEEAEKCLNNECYISAIAMSWATIDYAIEHELRGGSKFLKTSPVVGLTRLPLLFNRTSIKDKVEKLLTIFPSLSSWSNKLPRLYDKYRNTYLHAKFVNFKESHTSQTGPHITHITLENLDGEEELLAVERTMLDCRDSKTKELTKHQDTEMYIGMCKERIARQVFAATNQFLSALNQAVAAL